MRARRERATPSCHQGGGGGVGGDAGGVGDGAQGGDGARGGGARGAGVAGGRGDAGGEGGTNCVACTTHASEWGTSRSKFTHQPCARRVRKG